MKALVDQAMNDGAFGISTGLVYVPGTFAKTEEISELATTVARHKGLYVSHIRDEGVGEAKAIREALNIGEASGAHVHISHFKAQGPTQWGTVQTLLDLLRAAQSRGLVVSLDQYPYIASSTGLAVLVPSWLSDADLSSARRKLSNPATRQRALDEMLTELRQNGWKDYSYAKVAYCQSNPSLIGLSIAQITDQHARADASQAAFVKTSSKDTTLTRQAETILHIFSHGGAQMVFFDMNEDDVETIMKDPDVMFGSDSSVREDVEGTLPHPRGFGTFPRILGFYARDKNLFSLEEAVRRMTSLPATTFGITERGYVRTGYWADLVVFDRSEIQDRATYQQPMNAPAGIRYVIVNGSIVLDGQFIQDIFPGVPIRHEVSR